MNVSKMLHIHPFASMEASKKPNGEVVKGCSLILNTSPFARWALDSIRLSSTHHRPSTTLADCPERAFASRRKRTGENFFYLLKMVVIIFTVSLNFSLILAVDKKQIAKPLPVQKPKKIFVDGIKAVFRGSEGVDVVLASETNRPKLDGSPNSLQDTLTNLAFTQEARRYHIFPTPDEIEKQYEMIAQNNNKTVKELDEMVKQAGFTPQEARKEFGQINAVNSLINYKVTGNMVVPESEVVAYYEENPEYEPAAYQIQVVVVPFSVTQSREQQLAQLQTLANAKDPNGVLNWGEAFWVNEEDLAADKKFIAQLASTEISLPKELFNGFEMFRMIAKRSQRLKTLDERYGQIVTFLRRPKYTELMTKFQKDLMDNASIIIFDLPV